MRQGRRANQTASDTGNWYTSLLLSLRLLSGLWISLYLHTKGTKQPSEMPSPRERVKKTNEEKLSDKLLSDSQLLRGP